MYPRPGIDRDTADSANRSDQELQAPFRAAPVAIAACFDWLAFVESLGDEELAAEIVGLFIVETPSMMDRVRAAVREGSSEEIRLAAHAFKGAVGNLTRQGPMETSAQLEAMARGDSPGDAQGLMRRLDEQVAGLLDELKAVRKPKDPCAF
jgi:HPt (histidine-containing phosphotransfer) domain-containing protein